MIESKVSYHDLSTTHPREWLNGLAASGVNIDPDIVRVVKDQLNNSKVYVIGRDINVDMDVGVFNYFISSIDKVAVTVRLISLAHRDRFRSLLINNRVVYRW